MGPAISQEHRPPKKFYLYSTTLRTTKSILLVHNYNQQRYFVPNDLPCGMNYYEKTFEIFDKWL